MKTLVSMALLTLSVAACGGGGDDKLVISAAASLNEVFAELEAVFERDHPGVDVVVNTGGSSTLREQIAAGAPVDVFASASAPVMAALVDRGLVSTPQPFATNRLVLGLAPGNPASVASVADLEDPSLFVGLCAAQVPCGALADAVFRDLGLSVDPDTREPDVRSLTTKLVLGELDAGLIYATDVRANEELGALPTGSSESTTYTIALVGDANELAEQFIELVLSSAAGELLAEAGFLAP